MERRKFFKSLGTLGLAAFIPKFLLGKEEKNHVIIGNIDDSHNGNYNFKSYSSCVCLDLEGNEHLYITDNVNKPRYYKRLFNEVDFKFMHEMPQDEKEEKIIYPELPPGYVSTPFKTRIRWSEPKQF